MFKDVRKFKLERLKLPFEKQSAKARIKLTLKNCKKGQRGVQITAESMDKARLFIVNTEFLPSVLVSSFEFIDHLFQLGGVGSGKPVDRLTVLHEDECRHRADVVISSNLFSIIHIDSQEDGIGVLRRQRCVDGMDVLARSAPFGRKVDDDQLSTGILQDLFQVRLFSDNLHITVIAHVS